MTAHAEINREFLTIVEKSRELVLFISTNGSINYASPAAGTLLGFEEIEFRQMNVRDLVHPDDLCHLKARLCRILADPAKAISVQLRSVSSQGKFHWIEGLATNMLNEKGFNSIVVKFQDITSRILSEEESKAALLELSRKNQELNQFIYIISHNLRTPLSNLIGLINILESDLLDEYNKGIVGLFKSSTERLNETVFDLGHMLSLKEGAVKVTCVDVKEVFEKVCCSFHEQILRSGVTLYTSFSCSHLFFNKSYLESILMNFLSNSIKYRDYNRPLEIHLSVYKDEQQHCMLTFSDNGTGIDLDTNEHELFGLHKRFHNHITGNGVGLYITKSQVTSLGGTIEVSSKVNEGTIFSIRFGSSTSRADQNHLPVPQ
ncbi:sensor histidine kinase [Pedobacter hartonius]|uniref:histidine kinase n=1 Tax=Pedobacter hartonius TaxID=425514 RepID=A0A1H4FN85_9SPHI|nr:PAS domain-containing sensor histidine kinase [Pedobacter hartonius]SEA98611.1 hypothetical protein SAMN05443550_10814 [Pedobacter hartonius]